MASFLCDSSTSCNYNKNNAEAAIKENFMKAAKHGKLHEIQELREKFNIDFGLKDINERTAL